MNGRIFFLVLITIATLVLVACLPAMAQDPHYHNFSDTITIMGIPNFWNVVSNFPFLLIGGWGCVEFYKRRALAGFGVFWFSILFTGLGSAYYHWMPNNHTLLWDRLPMTLAFMSLLSVVISLHLNKEWGQRLLIPLLLIGVVSAVYWYYTELNNCGDLRWYAWVQFYPMLMIPLIVGLFPKSGTLTPLLYMLCFYVLAKLTEYYDHELHGIMHEMGGHPLKHLLAALAVVPGFQLMKNKKEK